jgi:UDP-N-acetylmuramoylalanine--D-glutamate ligase
MIDFTAISALVIGLGCRGRAACELLRRRGAKVVGLDGMDTPELRARTGELCAQGVEIRLGASALPECQLDLVVTSPAVAPGSPLVAAAIERGLPVISELELGALQSKCLALAIAGTNGKSTTGELIERVLIASHRRTALCGHRAQPVCAAVDKTKDLDFVILVANASQLAMTDRFHPSIAVLLNLVPDHREQFADADGFARANARLFRNQQAFDWAIIQSEALAELRKLEVPIPAKVLTFSATDVQADLHLDRGLIISRIPNWSGPLLDIDHCQLKGPHNVENLMAALAVGHVLRLPLEAMVDPAKTYSAGPHRFQLTAEINGVQFIDDSKANNLDALHKALLAARPGAGGEPNIWLIAGGKEQGAEFYNLGPILSRRVKRAFLLGEAGEKLRAAWSLFTPCTVVDSLLEAVNEAAKDALPGDVVLLSPACSSLGQFRDYQERGERFCQAVQSISRGAYVGNHNRNGRKIEM